MTNDLVLTEEEARFEALIQGLLSEGHGTCADFIDSLTANGLRSNLMNHKQSGDMRPAGISRQFDYQRNAEVRGDVIRWIENDTSDVFELLVLSRIQAFITYLNRTCYTAINDFEFHYAYYEQGSFYKRHLDQFKSDKGRKYSLVMYLNEDWLESDGGQLSLYHPDGTQENVLPVSGRAVFFESDKVEHEVHPSLNRYRLSIAGWLKQV